MWLKAASFGSQERSTDIAIDVWGSIYTVGFFSNSMALPGFPLQSAGGTDAFITKYDQTGHLLWAKSIGGSGDDDAWGLGTDSLGNVYVSGSFSDTVYFGTTKKVSKGFEDVFLIKLDSAGNQLWVQTAGTIYRDELAVLATNMNGETLLTGHFSNDQGATETIEFDNILLTSFGSADVFLAKYDTDGNVDWATHGGGMSIDVSSNVVLDKDGNAFVSGAYYGPTVATFGSHSVSHQSSGDAFLAKYDSMGDVMWVKSGSGNGADYGMSTATDKSGNVYLLGVFVSDNLSFGSVSLPGNGQYQVFVAKYNATGSLLWAKQYGGTGWDDPTAIVTDENGSFYITGLFIQTSTFGSYNLAGQVQEVFVVKCDSNGNVLWATSAGGTGSDIGTGLAYNQAENCLYVTGRCSGDAMFGPLSANSTGANFFLAKMSLITSAPDVIGGKDNLLVYPNPASDVINIRAPRSFSHVSISDQAGRIQLYQSLPANKQEASLNTSFLAPGLYWLRIEGNETTVHEKILITK